MEFIQTLPRNNEQVNTEVYKVSGCEARRFEYKNGNIIWTIKPKTGKTAFTPVLEMIELLEKERTKLKDDGKIF